MRRAARMVLMLCTGAAGAGLAVLVGVAVAQSFTLNVAKTATVTNANTQQSKVEAIAVRKGFAVYMLSGDSKSHPKCRVDNGCFGVWPPVKLSSAKNLSKAAGIKGKLGTWKRNGFIQLTLGGHPLYRYGGDGNRKNIATGEAINSFRGIWHVVLGAAGGSGGTTTTVTTGTTPTTTYTYPTTTYTYPMP